ncbi:MAG TPA: glycosyltransferase family 2 protein [Abditibacterium sp.]|jgi:rhamnopyranosyl-N-acetylglucosaminyl-diphospho-decaprenol beta-1,3/1,4-galactofuranosyltransferase
MSDRVCAVVVTFKRKHLLEGCLRALQGQSRPVDRILVVDNASKDGTVEFIQREFPSVEVLELAKNGGGAGGFHAGMKHAFEAGFEWIWIMDDDGTPAPDCLERLLKAKTGDEAEVLVPVQRDSGGRPYGVQIWDKFYVEVTPQIIAGERPARGEYLFAFVGPLVSRGVVEKVGLPRREFFIWFDDYEFCLRLQSELGACVELVPDADFHHDLGGKTREVRLLGRKSLRNESPAWKTYYGSRNHLFTVLRTRQNAREIGWFLVRDTWLLIGDVMFEPDRWKRVRLRLRGWADGALGRLGKRLVP